MLHQPLLTSTPLPPLNSSSASPSMQSFLYACSPQVVVEKEPKGMEVVGLKKSFRPEQQKQQQFEQQSSGEEMGWCFGDKGNLLGDVFVDELLNLNGFEEVEECFKGAVPFHPGQSSSSSALSSEAVPLAGITLPAHDAADLEWVSYIMDDTVSEFAQFTAKPAAPRAKPVESADSNNFYLRTTVRGKRSKRGRAPSNANSWSKSTALVPFLENSFTTTTSSASSSASSCLMYDVQTVVKDEAWVAKKYKPKKRGRKPKDRTADGSEATVAVGDRRCSHCGVTKTPQWRAGPEGAKTLCNACGVRYKSGRLLPEYRPACSPQFESSIHSNSHRKVLELRHRKAAELAAGGHVLNPVQLG